MAPQFSATRGFVSAPPYAELEALMSELLGGHALVCSSTSLGHQAALGVLATEKDAIVLDHQAHCGDPAGGAAHARRRGATWSWCGTGSWIVRSRCSSSSRRSTGRCGSPSTGSTACTAIWCPSICSGEALAVAPNVRLYVDDAHGTELGWRARSRQLPDPHGPERADGPGHLAQQGLAAGGGCLLFASDEERQLVRKTGGPLFFSGPLQPPMLGAAIASARLHLSPEIYARQDQLQDRVRLANRLIREAGLPLLVENESPIFFLRLGLPRLAFEVARRHDGRGALRRRPPSIPPCRCAAAGSACR